MKNKRTLTALWSIAFFVAATIMASVAQASCSLANVAGSYGYTTSGTVVSPPVGPFAAVGRVTFSSSGTLTGAQTTSIGGTLFNETVSGTYAVNADCTSTATVNVFHGTTLARTTNLNLVWDDHRNEIRAIFLTSGTVLTITARRTAPHEDEN
jgi:hypothetical protein